MSDITRWKLSEPTTRLQPDANGPWVALVDYYRVIDRLTAERDEARAEVERLRANGQGMFDSSRPSDEDIWREAFMTMLPNYPWDKAPEQSDRVLAEYRKRWPR